MKDPRIDKLSQVLEKDQLVKRFILDHDKDLPTTQMVDLLAERILKYIDKRDLTKSEMANELHKAIFGKDMSEEKPVRNLEIYGVAEILIKARDKKQGR